MFKAKGSSTKAYKRKAPGRLYRLAMEHIKRHGLPVSPESLFASFEEKLRLHKAFEEDLRTKSMNRERKSTDRRKLFIRWFFHAYASKRRPMSPFTEAAELTFLSERSVELLLKEALKEEEKSEKTETDREKCHVVRLP